MMLLVLHCNYQKDNEKQSACCNLNSINDAKRVAARLNIPHYTLNIRDNFKKESLIIL